jgi:NADH dehydrogenase [ubiquinone] 1 alpha subcomplex assembly factor 7
MSQADFLKGMGLSLRVAALATTAPSDQRREAIRDGAQRLVDRSGMGTQYQVLGITSGGVEQVLWPFVQR